MVLFVDVAISTGNSLLSIIIDVDDVVLMRKLQDV